MLDVPVFGSKDVQFYVLRSLENANTKSQFYQDKMKVKVKKRKMSIWQLEYVLRKLLPPQNKTITHNFGVFIPEVCFYKDGEAQSLYMNAEINEKDKVQGIREPSIIRIKK